MVGFLDEPLASRFRAHSAFVVLGVSAVALVCATATACSARQPVETPLQQPARSLDEPDVSQPQQPEPCPERAYDGEGDCDHGVSDENGLAALEGFTAITGNVIIESTPLVDLEALACLRAIQAPNSETCHTGRTGHGFMRPVNTGDGGIEIARNSALNTLEGLRNLASVDGVLVVLRNGMLTDLDGLRSVTHAGHSLVVQSNESLRSLAGLRGLASVGGYVVIRNNDALTNVDGLDHLSSISGSLTIRENASLTSLDGLDGLTHLAGTLDIIDNASLPTCMAEAFEARLRSLGWASEAHISGNDDAGVCQ